MYGGGGSRIGPWSINILYMTLYYRVYSIGLIHNIKLYKYIITKVDEWSRLVLMACVCYYENTIMDDYDDDNDVVIRVVIYYHHLLKQTLCVFSI